MTVGFIFVASVLAYLLLVLAFILEDYIIGMLSGIAILSIGIYIAIYNMENINTLLTQAFGLISILIGAFVFINLSKEKIEEYI